MDDKGLDDNEDLLLRLMERYKPHLKPYAYRLQTWEQVLEEYNQQTGTRYRQIRTLKKKFEKLRDAYDEGGDKIEVGNLELLQRLIRESKQPVTVRGQSQLKKNHAIEASNGSADSMPVIVRQSNDSFSNDMTFKETSNEGNDSSSSNNASAESSGPNQPPPLDSITIGFPHSHAQPHSESKVSATSSPSQRSIASSSYKAGSMHSSNIDSIRTGLNVDPGQVNSPSVKNSPQDHPSNPQMSSRMLSNLLSLVTNQAPLNKQSVPSSYSPLPMSNTNQTSDLTLEKFYEEFKRFQQVHENFRSEVLYKLDMISAGMTGGINLSEQFGPSSRDHHDREMKEDSIDDDRIPLE